MVMDIRRYGIAPFVICGVIGVAVYAIVGFALMFVDPNWHFGSNCLSDFGISSTPFVAAFFNGSCIVGGILIMIFGIGKVLIENKLNKLAGVLLIIGSIAMVLVGIFTIDVNKHVHDTCAAVFAGCFISGIIFATLSDIMKKDKLILISGILIAVFALLGLFFTSAGCAEVIGIVSGIIWFVFQIVKYKRDGAFSLFAESIKSKS